MAAKSPKTFKFPKIEVMGKSYDEVTVREPTYAEKYFPQKNFSVPPKPEEMIQYQTNLCCATTGLPIEVFSELPASVAEDVLNFLGLT